MEITISPALTRIRPIATLPTEKQLIDYLEQFGLNWVSWGNGDGSRSLKDLHEYLVHDQVTFRNVTEGPPIIDVKAAIVIVRHGLQELVEVRQVVTKTGSTIERGRLYRGIAETMRIGERAIHTAIRGLSEELGFNNSADYQLSSLKFVESRDPVPSEKWPGIMAAYYRHIFECVINDKLYRPEGYIHPEGDRNIIFEWRPYPYNPLG